MENNNLNTRSKELALHYIGPLVDMARESFLLLGPDLKVLLANPIFYQEFKVTPKQTENRFIYQLGNGQWDIPELKRLLENILPKAKIVRNYEVNHVFEVIGEKTMLLNARQIDSVQLIVLAIEDITDRKNLENKLAEYTEGLEKKIAERTEELASRVAELELANKTMIGRELKMVELKKEIKDIKTHDRDDKNSNGRKNKN